MFYPLFQNLYIYYIDFFNFKHLVSGPFSVYLTEYCIRFPIKTCMFSDFCTFFYYVYIYIYITYIYISFMRYTSHIIYRLIVTLLCLIVTKFQSELRLPESHISFFDIFSAVSCLNLFCIIGMEPLNFCF